MHRLPPFLAILGLAVLACAVAVPTASAGFVATITSVTPSSGPTAGGTTVTVRGTGLAGAGQLVVRFDGVEAPTTVVQYGTEFRAVAPPHAAGSVDVDVYEAIRNPPVIATLPRGFTYEATASPTVTSVSPATGPTTGGTSVTLTGTNFTGATAVSFGGTAATAFTVNGPTSITATTPPRAAGAADVAVTTPEGTATAAGGFTFAVYRTLTLRNVAARMPRGEAQYGATGSDTGAFATKGTVNGLQPIRNSGYTGGIYCGVREKPFELRKAFLGILSSWVPEISTGEACSWAYPTGTKVTLTALPSTSIIRSLGFIFPIPDGMGWHSGWGGACKGAEGLTCTITMDDDRTASAAFNGTGLNLDGTAYGGRVVLFNATTADAETGRISGFEIGWGNPGGTRPQPPGFIRFTTEVVGASATAREHAAASGPVVCRKRTRMVNWRGRVTCPVTPALARRLDTGPVRLATTVALKVKGRGDWLKVARRVTLLRNAAGTRVTG